MSKLYKMVELKDKDIFNIFKNEKKSFLIKGDEELEKVLKNEKMILKIKNNIKEIDKIIIELDSFKDILLEKLLFLEDEDVEIIFVDERSFIEIGIKSLIETKNKINKILKSLCLKNNKKEMIIKILNWIIQNIKYNNKYNVKNKEKLKERLLISKILENKETNCAGFTNLFYIFLDQIGVKNIKRSSKFHMWNLIELEEKKFNIDVTSLASLKRKNKKFKVNEYNFFVPEDKINNFGLYTGNINDKYSNK